MASITTFVRVEPQTDDPTLELTLQGRVRDPLWFLARQWQTGEFAGQDNGSPVNATLTVETQPLTHYTPAGAPATTKPLEPHVPLETQVEATALSLQLRAAVHFGLYFETQAKAGGADDTVIAALRNAFPLPPLPAGGIADPGTRAFYQLAAGRVTCTDGLAAALKNGAPPLPSGADAAVVATALRALGNYRNNLYDQPGSAPAWGALWLDHQFALSSPTATNPVTIIAPHFGGGHLDWYDFDPVATPLTGGLPQAMTTTTTATFLPQHVTFPGMPPNRWWNFEDGRIDLGELDTERTDLAKMLVAEFAVVYGNDWFEVPVPLTAGSLARVSTLTITDTFGRQTPIAAANDANWSIFELSDGITRAPHLLIPPSADTPLEGPALEETLFVRDNIAAMGWAVEDTFPGPLDTGTSGHDAWQRRLAQAAAGEPPAVPPGAGLAYRLEAFPPDFWIPLLPITVARATSDTPPATAPAPRDIATVIGSIAQPTAHPPTAGFATGTRLFRRAKMGLAPADGADLIKASSIVLEPAHPLLIADQAIPPAGTKVTVRFRRARGIDGSTHLWLARQTGPGRNVGSSGLAYDIGERIADSAPPGG